jgi:integrase
MHGKKPTDKLLTRESGVPVSDFRKSWRNICTAAGVAGLLFHDLRRTAARNMRNSGLAEGIIMAIGGWRTSSVFRRYAIVSKTDIASAMRKLEEHQAAEKATAKAEQEKQFGQSLGRVYSSEVTNESNQQTTVKPN